ncbi:MAG: 3-methyl-2-oxobutanoate hydroxymethyltransferase [Candidatus Margulisbacteria bacterium]|jgi:3-methyl-2-oxobutanoate hydroxymethyltransferase|nr:3-methyl-2-oxobutanoate hydroxymethyltransferase [Candidatus Margulisiibacteriota bacterium]
METLAKLQAKKNKEKITMLTVYSAALAAVFNNTAIEMLLVGDSLGTVFQGQENTLSVTLDEMLYHAQAVRRGAPDKFLAVDLPFLSSQVNAEQTLLNAGQIIKQTGANAVKLEGADPVTLESVRRMTAAGIPAIGHLGFTPQSVHALSGYKVQGRDAAAAKKLKADAKLLEKAGAFMLVLEMTPAKLSGEITRALKIPTIGIGAGADCDGQVLVCDDMLGLYPRPPRFVKRYADFAQTTAQAVEKYIAEVKQGKFPDAAHSF